MPAVKKTITTPGSYYYDDATGYEIYNPAQDGLDEQEQDAPANTVPAPESTVCGENGE
jgi:hypothetical protein